MSAQVFSIVPHGWMLTTIGDVCEPPQYGYTTKAAPKGDLYLLRTTDITKGEINWKTVPFCSKNPSDIGKYLLQDGDVVISRAGSVGVSYLVTNPPQAVYASYLIRFRPKINTKFFKYYLESPFYWEQITENKLGIAVPNVNASKLRGITLLVPSEEEQENIVAKVEELFSELDSGIASLKTAQQQLGIYRQSLLKHAFEGKLTEQWRKDNADKLETPEQLLARIQQEREARYQQQLEEWQQAVKDWEAEGKEGRRPTRVKKLKEFAPVEKSFVESLSALPSGWLWGPLGTLTTGVEYGTSAKSSEKGDIPVIRMGNMQGGKIDWNDLVYTSDEEEIKKYLLVKNDVLFNRTNSPELVGKTVKYAGERPAVFAGYLIRVNQVESIVDADYLNYFLNSQVAKNYGNTVKTDGVNQSNINGEKLQNYPFPFCSILEQQEIVNQLEERLSCVEQTEKEIETALDKAELLRQSILKKAFSGQLCAYGSSAGLN